MRKFDKIFAGLILVAMAMFWVVMAPAAFTARVSEAIPASLETSSKAETEAKRTLTESRERRQQSQQVVDARTLKLKVRDRDTPRDARERLNVRLLDDQDSPPPVMPFGDNSELDRVEDLPDFPIMY